MLTSRQLNILKDLLNTNKPITAVTLAKRHAVSQRSVRYDLQSIEDYLKKYDVIIDKKPRVGISIINKENAQKVLESFACKIDEGLVYSIRNRHNLILLQLMFSDTNITSDNLADILKISRSTVLTSIKEINNELNSHNIVIKGKQYYGYILEGNEEEIRKYFKSFIEKDVSDMYGENLWDNLNKFFDQKENDLLNDIFKEIKKRFSIKQSLKQESILKVNIGFLLKRLKLKNNISYDNDEISNHRSTLAFKNCEDIYYKVISSFNLNYDLSEVVYLNKLILTRTSNEDLINTEYDEKKLSEVVNQMVAIAYESLNIKEEELETLISDLMIHLKMTLNRCKLNIHAENSILEQIKIKYGDVFKVARKTSKVFEESYDCILSDDEIGFITMYFCKSLEYSKIRLKKNVLVVCNSSRGTSKLLAARIRNNIPEINIKDIVSVHDVKEVPEVLDDVDLIISTVKLEDMKKAYIVVSPIITMYNLSQIRDFLYINNTVYEEEEVSNDFEMTLYNIIKKYDINRNDSKKLYDEILNLLPHYYNGTVDSNNDTRESIYFEKIALILVEICEMLIRLYKDEINEEIFRKVFGVILHVFMAIPRWTAGEYNQEKDVDSFKQKYTDQYEIIEKTFNKITAKNDIYIDKAEIVSIIRYLL